MNKINGFARLVLCAAAALGFMVGAGHEGAKAQPPGNGEKIDMARPTWDTGWFQAEVYKQLLEMLGYEVGQLQTLDNPIFYQAVGNGDVDLWVNAWFPFAEVYKDAYEEGARKVGYVAKGGAMQGYGLRSTWTRSTCAITSTRSRLAIPRRWPMRSGATRQASRSCSTPGRQTGLWVS